MVVSGKDAIWPPIPPQSELSQARDAILAMLPRLGPSPPKDDKEAII